MTRRVMFNAISRGVLKNRIASSQALRHFTVKSIPKEVEQRTSLIESTLQSLEEDVEFQITSQNLKKLGQVW